MITEEYRMDIESLLTLITVQGKLPKFEKDLIELVKTTANSKGRKEGRIKTPAIEQIKRELKTLADDQEGYKKISKATGRFYGRYKKLIDEINSHCGIDGFLGRFYTRDGSHKTKDNGGYFWNYLEENEEQKEQIKANLEKMQSLGIERVRMNPNWDFSMQEHSVSKNVPENSSVVYAKGVTITGIQKEKDITYLIDAPYAIVTYPWQEDKKTEILVNNLIFSPSQLPDDISLKSIFTDLFDKEKQEFSDPFWTSLKLYVTNFDRLSIAIQELKEIMSSSDTLPNKNIVLRLLNDMEEKAQVLEPICELKTAAIKRKKRESIDYPNDASRVLAFYDARRELSTAINNLTILTEIEEHPNKGERLIALSEIRKRLPNIKQAATIYTEGLVDAGIVTREELETEKSKVKARVRRETLTRSNYRHR